MLTVFLKEFWFFMKHRKKLWLTPIIIVMLALSMMIVMLKGSVIAPFIYTIF